jgi:hypothetical protein
MIRNISVRFASKEFYLPLADSDFKIPICSSMMELSS